MLTTCMSEYFDFKHKFEEKYGKDTIVLCEVGSFFELYSHPTQDGSPTTAHIVGELLNFICTRKNKNKPPSSSNPYLVGVPTPSMARCIDLLVNTHQKTVVLVEQIEENKHGKGFKREVTKVLSPGTYHSELSDMDSLNKGVILSLHTKRSVCYRTQREIECGIVGWALIDTTTGKTTVHQLNTPAKGTEQDEEYANDNIQMLIETYNPKEIIVTSYDSIPSRFREKGTYFLSAIGDSVNLPDDYRKPSYQNEFIRKTINAGVWQSIEQNGLTPIEYIGMEFMSEAIVAYITLIQYVYDHDPSLLQDLSPPVIWQEDEHLILENNCVDQLNIFSQSAAAGGPRGTQVRKNEHLLGIIDFTRSYMGKRLLHNRLTNPITNVDLLKERYEVTETLLRSHDTSTISPIQLIDDCLVNICDMERIHRRMAMKKLTPIEFTKLHESYETALRLKDISDRVFLLPAKSEVRLSNSYCNRLQEYMKEYMKLYNFTELLKHDLNSIDTQIWLPGVHPEIDEICNEINESHSKMNSWCEKFNTILCDSLAKKDAVMIKLEETDKDGHFLALTKIRYDGTLLKKMKESDPELANQFKATFPAGKATSVKLTFPAFNQVSHKLISLQEKLKKMSKKLFIQETVDFHGKYVTTLSEVSAFVANMDVAKSYAKCTQKYKYCIPTVSEEGDEVALPASQQDRGELNAKGMRHAIIERINQTEAYVPNDVCFDSTTNGLIIYGCNSVGKSSLIKAIGLCVILAQMGHPVPCDSFTYRPFKNLFTRIKGNDDLVHGKSSFVVEMMELRTILKRANERSLVLGDEVCRGTEHTSGLSLVATTVNRLSKQGCSFMLATHHHGLPKWVSESKVKHMHLEMTMENGKCKYNRKLKDGSGTAIYGLEVAKCILDDEPFMEEAHRLRRQILDLHTMVVPNQKSRYNSHKYIGICEKCGKAKAVDTHHVQEQHDADENGFIGSMHKNHLSNLMGLCKECHNAEHN